MEYKYNINLVEAMSLTNIIAEMHSGGKQNRELRSQVGDIVKKAFAGVILPAGSKPPYPAKDIAINGQQMRSLVHGFIDMMDQEDRLESKGGKQAWVKGLTGDQYEIIKGLCKTLRTWKYVSDKIQADNADEFDGTLDDEPELVEPEAEGEEQTPPESSPEAGPDDEIKEAA